MKRTTTIEHEIETAEPQGGWSASVLFWLAVVVAAGLYASVVLSPKVLAYLELRDEYIDNQMQLVDLEREVDYLNSVAAALRTDPEFAAELARVDFDAVRPGEERIAVEEHLNLQTQAPVAAVAPPNVPYAEFARSLATLASRPNYRTGALLSSVILVVIAFSFFNGFQEASEPDEDEDEEEDDDDEPDDDDTEWDDEDEDE